MVNTAFAERQVSGSEEILQAVVDSMNVPVVIRGGGDVIANAAGAEFVSAGLDVQDRTSVRAVNLGGRPLVVCAKPLPHTLDRYWIYEIHDVQEPTARIQRATKKLAEVLHACGAQ